MKTTAKKIIIIVLSCIVAAGALCSLFYLLFVLPKKKYDSSNFGITEYKSEVDRDGDGIDDQSDILLSVKEYLNTKPRYKSVYYENGGWPDDNYGVCTDVVARGLLGAGYDLQELVDSDRREHPERYREGEAPDRNIDFRRVRNLLPFFQNNFISLTTDTSEIKEWQGGDIVVWEGHIGIISEHRNYKGVPFIYHHGSPEQKEYEENKLEHNGFGKILGHFRVS